MLKTIIDICKLIIIIAIIVLLLLFIYKTAKIHINSKINLVAEKLKYPKHIAFIMDGNGRWAKKQNQTRLYGHMNGSNNLEDIFYNCFSNGSQYLTFYVFAEQNWKRPEEEIKNIFDIIYRKMNLYMKEQVKYRIIVQGRLDRVPKKLRNLLTKIMERTKNCEKTIILCLDYSGRAEIINACKTIVEQGLEPTFDNFQKCLYVKDIPDPDLIIRTSGEQRISDFLLWQLSYSEFYFTDVYWPDFGLEELEKAIKEYNKRQRRFGIGA